MEKETSQGEREVLHQEWETVSAAYLEVEKEANQGEREDLYQEPGGCEKLTLRWRRRPARGRGRVSTRNWRLSVSRSVACDQLPCC